MFKEVKISEIDDSESLIDKNGVYVYCNIKLEAVDEKGFEQLWWAIYDVSDNKIYGYEYLINKKIPVDYDDKYEVEGGFSNIYIFKNEDYGLKVDERHKMLDEYLSIKENSEKLIENFIALHADSLL